MEKLTTILHPTDFSDSARQALVQAVRIARARDAALHVLHVVLLHEEDPAKTERLVQDYAAAAERERTTDPGGPGAPAPEYAVVRSTSAYEAIAQQVDQLRPRLIVMGTHGRSGLGRFLMGSVAEKVLRHAPCDVMTLRADAAVGARDGRFHRVLVPVDFSEPARTALARARDLAAGAGDVITLLHVVEPLPPMYYAGGLSRLEELDPELPDRVRDRLVAWADAPGAPVRVAEGPAAEAIVRVADEMGADLVAMGTRGLTGLEHVVLGSVTERVCRRARVPVLVAR